MSRTESYEQSPVVTNAVAESDSLLLAIVNAVAAVENVSATSLPPLSETVDVEALERVVESGGDGFVVSFTYAGYHVVVTGELVEVY
jgi:hypothetical protein